MEFSSRGFLISFIFLVFTLSLVSAGFGYDNPNLPSLRQELFDGKPSSFYMPNNKTPTGNFSFDGDCLNGGVEIKNGTICAQRLEVLNITNLNVTKQDLTITNDLDIFGNLSVDGNIMVGEDIIFPIGTANIRMIANGTNSLVFDTASTGSADVDFLSGSLASLKITHRPTFITIAASDLLSITTPDDMEFKITSAAGIITINAGGKDADIIFQSSSNPDAGFSDGGLFDGKGAWGFGREALNDAFMSIHPIAFESDANIPIYALRVAPTRITVPAGNTTNAGSMTVEEPKLVDDGIIENAFTLKIDGAPTEGTNNYALWVNSSGLNRFDGDANFTGNLYGNGSQLDGVLKDTGDTGTGDYNFTNALFVSQSNDVMSMFGNKPSGLASSDTQDRFVSRKTRVATGGNRRAGLFVLDINFDSVGYSNAGQGLNAFCYTGEGFTMVNTRANLGGGCTGGRYSFRMQSAGTFTLGGGVSSLVEITGSELGIIKDAYAFQDEGGNGGFGDGGILNYRGLWVRASETGSNITNKYGVYIDNLDEAGETYGIVVEGASEYSLWIMSGLSRFDDDVQINADLDTIGNINQTEGNLTGNMIHGSMGFHNDTTGNVTALTEDVWGNFTGFDQVDSNEQILNGVAYSNNILTILIGGVYDLDFGASFSGTVNNKYHAAIGINGVEQLFCESHDRISTGTDILSAGFPCSKRLSVGDQIMLMYMNENSGGDTTTLSARVRLTRIGN